MQQTNDNANVLSFLHKIVEQIKSPTEEGTAFLQEVLPNIETALINLKSYKPRKTKTTETDEKKPRGRPRVPYRAVLENGKYDTRPKDPEYLKRYYIENLQGVKVPCPHCGVHTFKITMARHMKSAKCRCHGMENKTDTD